MGTTSEAGRESLCNRENLRFSFALYSWGVSLALVILSVYGFKHLGNASTRSVEEVEETTSFGCLCFLGFCFGVLLFLAETRWEIFFVYFGFLRFRIGRAILYGVAGIMTWLMGKNMNQQCDCSDYGILVAEGVMALLACIFQLVALFMFGHASAPRPSVPPKESKPVDPPSSKINRKSKMTKDSRDTEGKADSEEFSSVVTSSSTTEKSSARQVDSGLPAWMNA